MPATFTAKFDFGYGWFLGEDPGTEPLDFQTRALDALIPDAFGEDVATTAGLTYGYRGGWIYNRVSTLPFKVVKGTINLPANKIVYLQRDQAGVVSFNEVGFTANYSPMAVITTNNFEIISREDARSFNSEFANYVTSVYGRTGSVVAVAGDYNALMITLMDGAAKSKYTVTTVQAVLDMLSSDMALALVSDVKSFGPFGGPARTGHIVANYGDYAASLIAVDDTLPGVSLASYANPTVQDALEVIAALGRVTSFNNRSGVVTPATNDYSCLQVSFDSTSAGVILFPPGVNQGTSAQSIINALKVHFHDATQITMNPEIFPGAETVQESLQWLKDNGGGLGGLTITTSNAQIGGSVPYAIALPLTAYGGTPANYVWSITSTTIPGAAITGPTGAKVLSANVLNPGTYTATIHLTDGIATADLNLVVVTTGAVSALVITTSTPINIRGYNNGTPLFSQPLAYSGGTGASNFSALVHGDTTTGINWAVTGQSLTANVNTTGDTPRTVTCRVRATDSVNTQVEKILTFNVTYSAIMTISVTPPASIVVTTAGSQTVAVPYVTAGGYSTRTVELYSAISGWGTTVNLGSNVTATVTSPTNVQVNYADTTTSSALNLNVPMRVRDVDGNVESTSFTLAFQKQSTLTLSYVAPPPQSTSNTSPYTFGPPTVSGGSGAGYSYSIVSVTNGALSKFSVNPGTGVVTYVPSSFSNLTQTYSVIIQVTDGAGNAKTAAANVAITAQVFANAPTITPSAFIQTYASPYVFIPLAATGGTAPDFTWTIDSLGTLPGTPVIVLVGSVYNLRVAAPNTHTTYSFGLKATNIDGGAAFVVTPCTLEVNSVATFNLTNVGSTADYNPAPTYPVDWEPTYVGAAGHVTLTVVSITPSTGLTYTKTTTGAIDTIKWSCTATGTYTVVITATDNVTTISNQTYYVDAAAAIITPTITTTTPKSAALSDAIDDTNTFTFTLGASGGSGFVWALEGAPSLVNGTGTPVLTGASFSLTLVSTNIAQLATCTQTVRVTNSTGGTITKAIVLRNTVYVPPAPITTTPNGGSTVDLYVNSDGTASETAYYQCSMSGTPQGAVTWSLSGGNNAYMTMSIDANTGLITVTPTGVADTTGGVYASAYFNVTIYDNGVVEGSSTSVTIRLNVTLVAAYTWQNFTVTPSFSAGQHYANFAGTILGAPPLVVVKENGITIATLANAGGNSYVGSISMSQYAQGFVSSGGFIGVASAANGSQSASSSNVASTSYRPMTASLSASISGQTLTYGMTNIVTAGANAGAFTVAYVDNKGETLPSTSTANAVKTLTIADAHVISGYVLTETGGYIASGTANVNVSIAETVAPVINVTSNPAASYPAGQNIIIAANATDAGAGIASFALFVNGVNVANNTTGAELTYTITGTTEGVNHSYYLTATDKAAVPNQTITTVDNITITAIPVIAAPALAATYTKTIWFTDLEATFQRTLTRSATGGVLSYTWSIADNGTPPLTYSIDPTTGTITYTWDTEGNYVLLVTCTSTGGTPGGAGSTTQTLTLSINYRVHVDGDTYCFTDDTYVLMMDGSKLITEMRVNDVHLSVKHGTLDLCESTVLQVHEPHMSSMEADKQIHRFMGLGITNNHGVGSMDLRFPALRELTLEDEVAILNADNSAVIGQPFTCSTVSDEQSLVYNFGTSEHSYFVSSNPNGPWYLVHNINYPS